MCKKSVRLTWMLITIVASLVCNVGFGQVLRLPSDSITYTVEDSDTSNFIVTLSGVPDGFDVGNATYASYCVSYNDTTQPYGTHPGILHDSSGTVPAAFDEAWSYINYVLNHKQGSADDVQAALWFFTDGVTNDLTAAAQAMIDDALANGAGFLPGAGQIVAVIIEALDDPAMQRIIIEVPIPTPPEVECDDFVTGGGFIVVASGKKANFGVHGGMRNGALWGGLNYIDHTDGMHVKSTEVTGYNHVDSLTRRISYNVTIDRQPGTAVVTVTDNDEPGTHDIFQIELSTGYSAGAELGDPDHQGGGGNIQLHKAHCDNASVNLLFQHTDSTLAIWKLDGTNVVGAGFLGNRKPRGWRVVAQGDFSADGQRDIVFQQDGTRKLAVWVMDGTNFVRSALLRRGTPVGAGWRIVGAADFNNDGSSDLLFQSENKTSLAIWLMNETNVISAISIRKNMNPHWHAAGTGDFNSDGKSDILWKNADGRTVVWHMNGTEFSNAVVLRGSGPSEASGWKVCGTGDINSDGHTDVLFQHNDGRISAWLFEGSNFRNAVSLKKSNPNWKAVGRK